MRDLVLEIIDMLFCWIGKLQPNSLSTSDLDTEILKRERSLNILDLYVSWYLKSSCGIIEIGIITLANSIQVGIFPVEWLYSYPVKMGEPRIVNCGVEVLIGAGI